MRKAVVYKNYLRKEEEAFTGVFHGFYQSGGSEEGFYPVAVIEDEEGHVNEYNTVQIRLLPEDK